MIVYEVNLDVEVAIAERYRVWLVEHVEHMLALPGFTGARMFEVTDPAPASDRIVFCVQYELCDQAALNTYLREHAARMRADGSARFGERFRASRRVLQPAAA